MHIHEIVVYTDFKLDESYTPSKISIRAGTTFHDLQEIHVEELNEPSGWVTILPPREQTADGGVLRTHFIRWRCWPTTKTGATRTSARSRSTRRGG